MASDRDRWINVEVDDEDEDVPAEAIGPTDEDDDVELHGQFFEKPTI
jgi:hypothetical protein